MLPPFLEANLLLLMSSKILDSLSSSSFYFLILTQYTWNTDDEAKAVC